MVKIYSELKIHFIYSASKFVRKRAKLRLDIKMLIDAVMALSGRRSPKYTTDQNYTYLVGSEWSAYVE